MHIEITFCNIASSLVFHENRFAYFSCILKIQNGYTNKPKLSARAIYKCRSYELASLGDIRAMLDPVSLGGGLVVSTCLAEFTLEAAINQCQGVGRTGTRRPPPAP